MKFLWILSDSISLSKKKSSKYIDKIRILQKKTQKTLRNTCENYKDKNFEKIFIFKHFSEKKNSSRIVKIFTKYM